MQDIRPLPADAVDNRRGGLISGTEPVTSSPASSTCSISPILTPASSINGDDGSTADAVGEEDAEAAEKIAVAAKAIDRWLLSFEAHFDPSTAVWRKFEVLYME